MWGYLAQPSCQGCRKGWPLNMHLMTFLPCYLSDREHRVCNPIRRILYYPCLTTSFNISGWEQDLHPWKCLCRQHSVGFGYIRTHNGPFLSTLVQKNLLEFPHPRHLLSSFKQLIKRAEINFLASQRKYNFLFPYCKMWTGFSKGKIHLNSGQINAPFPVQQNSPSPPPPKSTGVLLTTSYIQAWKMHPV